MNVTLDADVCGGHGNCVGLVPDVFELTDVGYSVVLRADVPADRQNAVRMAVDQCPTNAITITGSPDIGD